MGFDPAKLQAFLAKSNAAKAQTGGKGTVRRKHKAVRKNTTQDNKKMKAILNKLNVRDIPAIEEVNLFKKDNQIIHFKSPKVEASIAANTFVISGQAQEKKLEELLPGILSQLAPENLDELKKLFEQFQKKSGKTAGADEDLPDLVEDFEQVSKKAPSAEPPIVLPAVVTPQGDSKYITYDDDLSLGQTFPSLSTLEYVTDNSIARPEAGKPFLLLTWAQYHKPGYPYLSLYSELSKKYGSRLPFVAVSVDPDVGATKKYLKDPDGKYNKVYPLTFSAAFDKGGVIKASLSKILTVPLSLPHMFLVDGNNKIVWRQDHSMIGQLAVPHIDIVESQASRLVTGVPLQSTGKRPHTKEEDEDEDAPEEAAGGNVASLAQFINAAEEEAEEENDAPKKPAGKSGANY